jgi:23S rRNA (pseudouridine1915-N3)-methyltransferase
MKIELLAMHPTNESWLKEEINRYIKRINHYQPFEYIEIKSPKAKSGNKTNNLQTEGLALLSKIKKQDYLILLDEKGKQYTSSDFSHFMQTRFNAGHKKIIFAIGGAYGFSPELHGRANQLLSLSKMTFTHQMIRLVFVEQLYRAFTILNNEPYHH